MNAYIEIVPTDTVKYEIDKDSGHLKVDRPQKYSNYCPTLYGFIPQTYCGARVGKHGSGERPNALKGDGDPLDICVLSERPITHGDILVSARPIGGFCMIDADEVDDKIIAVLESDPVYGGWTDIADCSESVIARLKHYFLTYKFSPEQNGENQVQIGEIYGARQAHQIIELSKEDYADLK